MSEANVTQSSTSGQSTETKEVVVNRSAEEYAKRLTEVSEEAKEWRKKFSELKTAKDEAEKAALAEQGKFKELYEKAQAESKEKEELLIKKEAALLYNQTRSQVVQAALKEGCVDAEALIALSDLKQLSVNKETYEVSSDSIQALLENMKKSKSYLFQKAAPQVEHGKTSTVPVTGDGTKKKSIEEMALEFAKLGIKQ